MLFSPHNNTESSYVSAALNAKLNEYDDEMKNILESIQRLLEDSSKAIIFKKRIDMSIHGVSIIKAHKHRIDQIGLPKLFHYLDLINSYDLKKSGVIKKLSTIRSLYLYMEIIEIDLED